jgi:hypothetical protein
MTCHLALTRDHNYIIVVVDYFNKWAKDIMNFSNNGETKTLFIFIKVIARFGVPKDILIDHGSHLQNKMM